MPAMMCHKENKITCQVSCSKCIMSHATFWYVWCNLCHFCRHVNSCIMYWKPFSQTVLVYSITSTSIKHDVIKIREKESRLYYVVLVLWVTLLVECNFYFLSLFVLYCFNLSPLCWFASSLVTSTINNAFSWGKIKTLTTGCTNHRMWSNWIDLVMYSALYYL